MRKTVSIVCIATMMVIGAVGGTSVARGDAKKQETGKDIALNRTEGNCLACHAMPGISENVLPGDVGPPLVNISSRFKREDLRARIWDEMKFNQNTSMPPFGKHKILSETEIDKVTDFIYGL